MVDEDGNVNANGHAVTIAGAPQPDTQAPTIPSNLVTSVSDTQIDLSWTTSTDNVGVTGYEVERCMDTGCSTFSSIATVTGNTYSDFGLTINKTYRYRVRAYDKAGNNSGYSSVISVTTKDSTPPGAPSGFTSQ